MTDNKQLHEIQTEQAQSPANASRKKTMPPKKRRRRLGDRKDGRRLRGITPMTRITPYIMPYRYDACNTFADSINVSRVDDLCRRKVKQGMTNFSMLHVILAAYIRTVSQRPALNRFVSGQKIYARHNIEVNMVVKRKMTLDTPDACIKVIFDPTDTLDDVYEKFNKAVMDNKDEDGSNGTDKLNKVLLCIPGLLLRWTIKFIKFLDYFGWLPKFITNLSPFHGSMIITSMGSLGIKPIYHHLYEFGNLPVFIAYGAKRTVYEPDGEGKVHKRRYVDLKVVTDERICDGFYYASAFKLFRRILEHPEQLELPPEQVFEDVD